MKGKGNSRSLIYPKNNENFSEEDKLECKNLLEELKQRDKLESFYWPVSRKGKI
jgi:hypothetical protein